MDHPHTAALLAALAAELSSVRSGIEGLAELVSAHVQACAPHERAKALQDGQAIDVLSQRLDVLYGFTHSVAHGASVEDALGEVRLADVAERLRMSMFATPPSSADGADAGELVLFD